MVAYASGETRLQNRRGKGFLCLCANVVLPGLGQGLAGRWRRGIVLFVIWGLVVAGTLYCLGIARPLRPLLLLAPLCLLTGVWSYIDGYIVGRNSERRLLGRPFLRYAAGAGLLAVGGVLQPATLVVRSVQNYWRRHSAFQPTRCRQRWRRWTASSWRGDCRCGGGTLLFFALQTIRGSCIQSA